MTGSPKKRKTRHRASKFESAVQSFKTVLTGQHEDNMKLATSMQQQWVKLEKKRVDAEREERERDRQHELQMMQIFSSMFNANPLQVHQPQILAQPESQHHQHTFTDISNSTPPTNYFPHF